MDKVTALVIGDPHIRTTEVEYTDLMLKETLEVAKSRPLDFIVVLGDVLHNHNKVDTDPLTRAIDWLGELSDISHLYLLIGNHELRNPKVNLTKLKVKEHPFTSLKRWKNTTVVDDVTIFEHKGYKFCATPFLPEGEYHEAIKDVDDSSITAYFSHTNFYGVKYSISDKSPAECHDVWPSERKLMIAGHNHEYQIVSDNLYYVGTPCQQDFGANQDKAISFFTFHNGEIEMKRLQLVTVPLRTIHIIKADDILYLSQLLIDLSTSTRINLVKIKIVGTKAELSALSKNDVYKQLKEIKSVKITDEPVDEGIEKPIIQINSRPDAGFDEIVRGVIKESAELLSAFDNLY